MNSTAVFARKTLRQFFPLQFAVPKSFWTHSMDEEFSKIMKTEYKIEKDLEAVLKIRQNYGTHKVDEHADISFGISSKNFLSTYLHPVELRAERTFAHFLPLHPFIIKRFFRKIMTLVIYENFQKHQIFAQHDIIKGTRMAFELVFQSIYKNAWAELIARELFNKEFVLSVRDRLNLLDTERKEVLNVTEDDIIGIAPGILGAFQNIYLSRQENKWYINYSILCSAFYKKNLLYDSVKNMELKDKSLFRVLVAPRKEKYMAIPSNYGFVTPRLLLAYFDFSHSFDPINSKVDRIVNLSNLQFIVL